MSNILHEIYGKGGNEQQILASYMKYIARGAISDSSYIKYMAREAMSN